MFSPRQTVQIGREVAARDWSVEVADTCCRTLMPASSLGAPLQKIPPEKLADLPEIKQKLGLPDPRPPGPEESNKPQAQAPAETPNTKPPAVTGAGSLDLEALVASVTEQVLRFINGNK